MKLTYTVGGKRKSIKADDLMDLVSLFSEASQSHPAGSVSAVQVEVEYDELDNVLRTSSYGRPDDAPNVFDEVVGAPRYLVGGVPVGNVGPGDPLPLPKMF